MKKHSSVGLVVLLLASSVSAEMRIWRDQAGRQIEGEFSKIFAQDVVVVAPNGAKHFLPLSGLSKGDAAYLSDTLAPEVDIRFSKKKIAKIRSKNALPDDHVSIVVGLVQIHSKDKIPNEALRAEAYLIGKERLSGKYQIIHKASSALKFTEENDYRDQLQLEGESRYYREYNLDVRGVEYEGYVVFVLNRQNEIVDHATDLSWVTEDKFEMFRQLKAWYFFSEKCKRTSVPRPAYSLSRSGIR
jgi:hypothetical protein